MVFLDNGKHGAMEKISTTLNNVDEPHFTPTTTFPVDLLMLYFLFITYHPLDIYTFNIFVCLLSLSPMEM